MLPSWQSVKRAVAEIENGNDLCTCSVYGVLAELCYNFVIKIVHVLLPHTRQRIEKPGF